MRRPLPHITYIAKPLRLALFLITLLLLPSTAWGARYTTTGNVTLDSQMGTGDKYYWTINSGSSWKWSIVRSSSNVNISQSNKFSATWQYGDGTVTLTATNSISDSGLLRKIYLDGLTTSGECTITVKLGDTSLASGSHGEYSLDTPSAWGSSTITITIQGSTNATCEISSISILTGSDDSSTNFVFNLSDCLNEYISSSGSGVLSVSYNKDAEASKTFTALLSPSEGRTIKYASTNPAIALVDEGTGVVTLTGTEGEAVISATPEENDNYYGYGQNAGNSYTVTVQKAPINYAITIAGIQVTDVNASGITGDNIILGTDGYVTFTLADADRYSDGYNYWPTLTLNNATINGSIEWSETVYPNLRIVVNGTCKVIKETEGDTPLPAIKYSGTGTPTVHISKNSTDATLLIASYKNKGTSNGSVFSGFNSTIGVDDGLHQTTLYPDDGENYQIRYTCYTTAKVYDLAVAGIQVHEISSDFQGYKDHILKGQLENSVYTRNTTVTFDGTQLTLNNAAIETSSSANAIITGLDLSINLIGTNTITTASGYAFSRSSQESRTVSFTSSSSPAGTLTLSKSLDPQGLTSGITLDTTGGWTVTILNPENVTSLNNATHAIITKGAFTGLKIAGTPITSDYLDANGVISGVSGITGTVTYNATNSTLTLNTATINGSIKSNIDNLVVHLIGNNTMSGVSASNKPFQYIGNGSGSLSFTQEEVENDNSSVFGRLEASYENTSSFSWTDGYNISTTFETSDKTGWVQETGTTSATIRYVEYYDLWISSMHFNSENLSGVSGGTRFYPKTNTLHLEGFGYSDIIKSQLANLIIEVSGSGNTPTAILYEGSSDGTLLIKNDPLSTSTKLTLQNPDGAVISGFSTVTLDGLYFLTPNYPSETTSSDWTPTVKEAIITNEYGITVAGVAVTTTNSSNVLGTPDGTEPTVSYDPTGNVLTLNGYNGTYTAGDFIVSNLSDGLTVNLKGSNSVKVGDGTTNHFAIKNVSASTPYLTFITDNVETPGTFKIDSYASGGPFSGFNSDVNWPKDSNNQLISEGTAMNNNIFVISPDLMVGGKRIVTGNSYTFGEGTVSYTYQDSKNILTLDGAVISGEIECRYDNLTVYLKGENEINPSNSQNSPFSYIGDMVVSGTLTFESSEADDGELTLRGAFSETGSSPNKKITSGGYTTTTEFDTGLSYTFGDWIIETSKIYYNPHYGITINSYETTKCNKDNITKTNSGGVFTYSPQAETLSIPLDYDGSGTDIKSQRDDLIVSISGNTAIRSIIHEPSQSGTLLIKNAPSSSSTVNKLTLQNSTGAVISGFSTVTLDGLYFLTPNYPSVTTSTDWTSTVKEAIITNETLSAPTMSSKTVDGVSTLTLESTADNGTIKYSIDYVDASQTDITDAIYDSSSKPTINKPATVTAKVTLNEVESVTTTGKYFGTDPSPFRLISGADPIVLDLTPAIEESDGISITSITGTESNVTYDAGTGKISSSSVGSFNGQVSMSSTEGKTVILNNNFTATFNVQIDISQAVITLDNTELIYNGQEQTVNVTKVMVGDDVVPQDYYEVSGYTGTEVGNYTLTVTAKTMDMQGNPIYNNYTGSADVIWKITNHPTASASELGFNTETQTFSTYYNPDKDFNLPDGYVGYIIIGIEGSKVLTARISYIPKGVAVLVEKGTSTKDPIEEIPSEQPLKGTAEPLDVTSITGGTVYVLYNGMFVKSTSGTIPEKRCYLLIDTNVAAGTRGFIIDHGEGSTALRSVAAEGTHGKSDAWYTLQGRRLSTKPSAPGLYLHNGLKVVIK